MCEVPEYTVFAIWLPPGLPPKVSFGVMFLLPEVNAKSTSKHRVQNVDFGARGMFGTDARKHTFSGCGPGPWRCENTTPVVRDACHGARTKYIRQLPRELVLGTFSMITARPRPRFVALVLFLFKETYSEMECLPEFYFP